jgi:hypothetical protein
VPLDMADHAGRAGGTLRLASGGRMLPIQPLEIGGLLVIQHLPEIVVVLHFPRSPTVGPPATRAGSLREGVEPPGQG